MSDRQTVMVRTFYAERYDGGWPPEGLLEFARWVQEQVEAIPEEHRASAKIDIDSESGYEGDHYPSVAISYTQRM